MTRGLLLGLSLALAACQPAFIDGVPNEESPYFEVPVGSTLVLNQSLRVQPRSDRLYFQGGRVLAWYDVNEYAPYCALRLRTKSDQARTIEPDRFAVRDVSARHLFHLAQASGRAARAVAGPWSALAVIDRDDDGGDSYEVLATVMALASARQPGVVRLTCADWTLPQGSPSITVRKIRLALGRFFDLELAAP